MPASPVRTSRPPARTSPTQWLVLALIGALAVALVVLALQRDGAATLAEAPLPAQAPEAGTGDRGQAPQDGPAAEAVAPQNPATLDLARRDPADALAAGPINAPVVMVDRKSVV